jgi:hypothetical protein
MSKNGLYRHYDKLEPKERFRLDVLAMARGDMQESERLVSSCPKLPYKMNDRAFTGRWTGALELILRTYLPLADYLAKLQMVGMFREVVPDLDNLERESAREVYLDGHRAGSRHAWKEASQKTETAPEWPLEEDLEARETKLGRSRLFSGELLDTLEKGLAHKAFKRWAAFAGFCAESMGVEAEKILAVALGPGPVERVEVLEELANRLGLKPEAETVEGEREELARGWKIVEDRGL